MSFLGIPELTVVCTECSLAAWRILVVSLGFCVNFSKLKTEGYALSSWGSCDPAQNIIGPVFQKEPEM